MLSKLLLSYIKMKVDLLARFIDEDVVEPRKIIALFPAHPAQLWLMVAVKSWVEKENANINFRWFFRDKDVTLALARSLGISGIVVSKASTGLLGNAFELFFNIAKCLYYSRKYNIDLWLTKYGCGNIAARLLRIKNISFNDDDEDVVPLIARTSYPFADVLLFPEFTRNGSFHEKAIYYNSLHELAYIDINKEKVTNEKKGKPRYVFIRVSALKAHHDIGHSGVSLEFLDRLIALFRSRGIKVYISSESELPPRFRSMLTTVDVSAIHSFLEGACFYVGDSQTMAIEASLLGVPTVRISDFDNLSVIQHLENNGLIKSFSPGDNSALDYIQEFVEDYDANADQFLRRVKALGDKCEDTSEVFGKAILSLLER